MDKSAKHSEASSEVQNSRPEAEAECFKIRCGLTGVVEEGSRVRVIPKGKDFEGIPA